MGGPADPVDSRVGRNLQHVGARDQGLGALHGAGRGVDFEDAQAAHARVRLLDRGRAQREEHHVDLAAHEIFRLARDVRRRDFYDIVVAEARVGKMGCDDAAYRLLRVEVARYALAPQIGDRVDFRVGADVHRDAVGNERADVTHHRMLALSFVFAGTAREEGGVEGIRDVEVRRAAFHLLEAGARLGLDDGPELRLVDQYLGHRLAGRVGERACRSRDDADRLGARRAHGKERQYETL